MVGAKEFAINRKVIQVKKKNPVIESITLPKSMRSHEAEMNKMTGSFLDKAPIKSKEDMHYAPRMAKEFDSQTINPILADSRKSNHNDSSFARVPFLKRPNKHEERKYNHEEEEVNISDELANRITYKVFQNIKNYLNNDMGKHSGNKSIKLEISL